MRRLDRMTAPHWMALYATLLLAWAALWATATDAPGTDWMADLCRATPDALGVAGASAMWALMGAAMMLPTAVPAFATYDDLADAHGLNGGGALVAGYAAVWGGFAVAAGTAQVALSGAGLLDAAGVARPWLAALLLALAGLYQFSPLKAACLSRCRAPLTFLMAHWAEGPWRMGLRLGAACLGCCWALMLLAFVGGMASLGLMALGTLLMAAEKIDAGPRLTRLVGIACLLGAGYCIGGLP